MLRTTPIADFLAALASDSPTPGGGSAAALSGALGAALVGMVARLTVGKKKYADVEVEMKEVGERADVARARLEALIDEDADAFQAVMAAIRMPKETAEERERREAALQEAYRAASQVPLETARQCLEVLRLSLPTAMKGNVNARSDAGAAAALARAGLAAAALNVRINLPSITDADFAAATEAALTGYLTQAQSLLEPLRSALREAAL